MPYIAALFAAPVVCVAVEQQTQSLRDESGALLQAQRFTVVATETDHEEMTTHPVGFTKQGANGCSNYGPATEESCRAFAATMGKTVYVREESHVPYGCIYVNSKKQVRWNTPAAGQAHSGVTPICECVYGKSGDQCAPKSVGLTLLESSGCFFRNPATRTWCEEKANSMGKGFTEVNMSDVPSGCTYYHGSNEAVRWNTYDGGKSDPLSTPICECETDSDGRNCVRDTVAGEIGYGFAGGSFCQGGKRVFDANECARVAESLSLPIVDRNEHSRNGEAGWPYLPHGCIFAPARDPGGPGGHLFANSRRRTVRWNPQDGPCGQWDTAPICKCEAGLKDDGRTCASPDDPLTTGCRNPAGDLFPGAVEDCTNEDYFHIWRGDELEAFVEPTSVPGADLHWETMRVQSDGWQGTCVAVVNTLGGNCKDWCKARGLECVKAMADAHHQKEQLETFGHRQHMYALAKGAYPKAPRGEWLSPGLANAGLLLCAMGG